MYCVVHIYWSVIILFRVLNLQECYHRAADCGGISRVEQLDVSAEGANYDDDMREPHVGREWSNSVSIALPVLGYSRRKQTGVLL